MALRPSTQWKEEIPAGEDERMASMARQFTQMQQAKNERYGKGRALHRKQQLGLRASLEVLPGLPAHARHGLFAVPGQYDALVRLSNGGSDRARDNVPDIRGYTIKVLGVTGPGALGGAASSQDFLLINHAKLALNDLDEFVGVAMSAARGPAAVLKFMIGYHGLFKGVARIAELARTMGKPFSGFATEAFHSVASICCGPYLVRVRLTPASSQVDPAARRALADDVKGRLRAGALVHELQFQFFVDEAVTPADNLGVEWPVAESPWVTVARLTVHQQDPDSADGQALAARIEAERFDPWGGLAAHRPVGEVMRARKATYFVSQQGRGAA